MLIKRNTFACVCMLACGMAQAAVSDNSEAPMMRLGGVSVYPGGEVAVKRDSNITRLPDSDPAKLSSSISVLSPTLELQAEKADDKYSLAYRADVGRYSNSSADNYVDQSLLGEAEMGLSLSSTLKLMPAFLIGHDDRGSTFGTPTTEPNVWHSALLNGSLIYGAEQARGRVVVDLGYTDLHYKNNRTVTADYDKKLTSVGGTFYYRVQPKTSLLVNAKQTGIAYKSIGPIPDSNEQRLRVGVKWEATVQTSGEVQIGQVQKKFDSTLPTYSGGSWEADVVWSPLPYVNVDLVSSKQTNETTLAGSNAILLSNTGANLAYDLNDRVTLHANGYQLKEDFVGVDRSDNTNTFGLKAEYKFRKWLVGGAEYTNSSKTSNDALSEYKRNIFTLSVRSEL